MQTVATYAFTANASNDVQSAGEAAYVSMANARTRGAKNAVVESLDEATDAEPQSSLEDSEAIFFCHTKITAWAE